MASRSLSPADLAVVRLVARGFTNAEVAARLGTNVHAVRNRLRIIFLKLGVHNRTQLAAWWLRRTEVAS